MPTNRRETAEHNLALFLEDAGPNGLRLGQRARLAMVAGVVSQRQLEAVISELFTLDVAIEKSGAVHVQGAGAAREVA